MRDYFKDVFRVNNLSLIGSYDENKKLYNLTMREGPYSLARPAAIESTSGDGNDFVDYIADNPIGYFIPSDSGGQGAIKFWQSDINGTYVGSGSTTAAATVTQFILPALDAYGNISANFTALINAFNDCPNGSVYLHYHVLHGNMPPGETPSPPPGPNGAPIATYLITSIDDPAVPPNGTGSGTASASSLLGDNYGINVQFHSGAGAQLDNVYFWWSTEGCDVEFGGDSSIESRDVDDLGFVEITSSFSEDTKGWTSFKSWLQECGTSLNDSYFTFNLGELFHHHSNDIRNSFYGTEYDSTVCTVFNDGPSRIKNFGSLSYEGSQSKIVANTIDGEYYNQVDVDGWYAEYISTDLETGFVPEFREKEGKWFNYIKGNQANTLANLDVTQFSTQGIGNPSVISTDEEDPKEPFTLTIKDTGDTD